MSCLLNSEMESRPGSHLISKNLGDLTDFDELEHEEINTADSSTHETSNANNQNRNASDPPELNTNPNTSNLSQNTIRNPVYALIEKINHVIYGTHVTKCIQNPFQDLEESKRDFQDIDSNTSTSFKKYFRKNEDGCLEVINDFIMKHDKLIINHKVKELSKNILAGKSPWNLGLPVKVFEPKSTLEKIAEELIYAPNLLEVAGTLSDPAEQMKAVVTFWLASLHTQIHPQRSFNPLVGETFQAVIGGSPLYIEHVSNTPPISVFQMCGNNYSICGKYEFWNLSSGSGTKMQKVGFPTVHFKNTNAKILVQLPTIAHIGKTMGAGCYCFDEKMVVVDYENKLYAEIDFGGEIGGLFCSNPKVKKDKVRGGIWRMSKKFSDKLLSQATKDRTIKLKFKENKHSTSKIANVTGSWLDSVQINQETTWCLSGNQLFNLNYFDNPLPSDSNYRLDVLYLRGGDEKKAQDELESLEIQSQKDADKREKHFHKYKN